jgi:hypothetical protein
MCSHKKYSPLITVFWYNFLSVGIRFKYMMAIALKKSYSTVQTTAYTLVSFEHFLRKIIGQRISQSLFVVRGCGSLDAELLRLCFLLLIDILQTMCNLVADYFGSLKKILTARVAEPHNFYAAPAPTLLYSKPAF